MTPTWPYNTKCSSAFTKKTFLKVGRDFQMKTQGQLSNDNILLSQKIISLFRKSNFCISFIFFDIFKTIKILKSKILHFNLACHFITRLTHQTAPNILQRNFYWHCGHKIYLQGCANFLRSKSKKSTFCRSKQVDYYLFFKYKNK